MTSTNGTNNSPQALPSTALERVAQGALEYVRDGMDLGLGTGRTAAAFINALGQRVREGLSVRGVPTSIRSAELATSLGIELVSLDDVERLDIAFDGADEVTPELNLTKGRGGALLREKVVAAAADRFVVFITPEKQVTLLGSTTPIPIEVVPFACSPVSRRLTALGAEPVTRMAGEGSPYRTDNGNLIVDADFGPIADPSRIESELQKMPGIVDSGLFLAMTDIVLVAGPNGVEKLER